jgi:polysaccharide export outer membrane protein
MVKICWRKSSLAVFFSILSAACGAMPQNPPRGEVSGGPAASPSTVTADINRNIAAAAMSQASASLDYQVGPEDLLEITLFNVPEALGMDRQVTPRTTSVRVSQQGQISLPLVGEISTKGLTASGLEQRVRDAYDRYIHNPQVGVLVKEFRQRVSIIGAVQKPGIVELTGPKTVIEVLAIAGGVTEKAGSQVHIYRQGIKGRETHVIDLAVLGNTGLIVTSDASMINMPVEPSDMINIPESGMFFVDGAVRKPGSYPLGRRYTLAQALATAGGVDPELNANDIAIFRRKGAGEVQTIAINLNEMINGHTGDPQIQPDDVIMVPTSTAKYVVKRFVGTLLGGISLGGFFP